MMTCAHSPATTVAWAGLTFLLVASGCGDDDVATPDASTPTDDAGPPVDGSDGVDGGASTDAGPSVTLDEMEPNGADPIEDVNMLPVDATMRGTIGTVGDVDVFHVATEGAHLYRIELMVPVGSAIDGHLTILDTGRHGDPPGDDYQRLATDPGAFSADVDFLAMGDGHFVIVRDARNVGGDPVEGSDDHRYELRITELEVDGAASPLSRPSTFDGALDRPSGIALYTFEGTEGNDVRFDVQATGDLDLYAYVVARSTGDWIARQDDRALDDLDPLLDAPLTEGGELLFYLESPNSDGTSLEFTVMAQ